MTYKTSFHNLAEHLEEGGAAADEFLSASWPRCFVK